MSLTRNSSRPLPGYLQERANSERWGRVRQRSNQIRESGTRAAQTYHDFKMMFWRGYEPLPYQRAIDRVLMRVARHVLSGGTDPQGVPRAMIFVPPRHGKTRNVSQTFPAWLLAQNRQLRILNSGYGAKLAERNSRAVRTLIKSRDYQKLYPNVRLDPSSGAADLWDLEDADGGMMAAGISTGIAGHGFNLITIDDIVKSRHEAESATYRENAEDWYQNELITRLEEPGGAMILMLTRWHQHDLAGFILQNEPNDWLVLKLPALAGQDDPLGRLPGEPLYARRYGREMLMKRAAVMGEYAFSSIYQQEPLPAGSRLFDTVLIGILDYAPEVTRTVRFWDLAVTEKVRADYTVGVKMGVTHDERYPILDVARVQREFPDVVKLIKQTAQSDGSNVEIVLEAEKAGIIGVQELLRDPELRGYTISAVSPIGDKYSRAMPFAARVNGGKVYAARGAWNRPYFDELSTFPLGEHDDQVDASSGAYTELSKPKGFVLA